ncbi:hypothetical protein TGAM01_v203191 [Trichoderma gamsii]|uniref:Uncharacterized protein n=1 Tax=Trichoderma gamsii TaxID=398673 RepID=A0A2P4ZUU4_9HYPO|nr:hypothetical protein TGAM01_v203191 [Trichoderma gamsii]PON28054.1 hypothetical protein TGAM01_v203191 [Trichoderma gamsii]
MADASMLYTIGAYATLIGFGYAIYHFSTQKDKQKGGVTITKPAKAPQQPTVRKEDRKKKQRMESYATESKSSKPEAQKEKAPEANQWLSNDAEKQEKLDNREFARQLSKAKEGAKFDNKKEAAKQREKTVKQSKANKSKAAPAPEAVVSAPSSNGADADDDESPVALSPETRPVDVSGVSDMLEPASTTGPSVLRLTDTESKKQKKKASKNPEPVETKKQRQNKKKAEAAKAARDETEKERKVLEEKQRRTARIAEGRAAKDGSEFMAAVNGKKSAWDGTNGTNGAAAKNGDAAAYAPLDTFEKSTPAPTAKKETVNQLESSWISALPSEEEQMEMLKEESDEWNTVKTKSSKKSKKASSVESGEEATQARPAAQTQQSTETKNRPAAKPAAAKNFGGSFSALTTKDDDAEEEVEEEWDV